MITVTFYSFAKKRNSTKQPSTGTDLSCLVKSDSSIINPVIEVSTDPTGYNYCYIAAFGRYYYIEDIVFQKGIWICYCSVDVLATYKSQIGSSSFYVTRSASSYDGNIVDAQYPATSDVVFSNTATATNPFSWSGFTGGVYVICLMTSDTGNTNGVIYYVLEPAEFAKLIQDFYSDTSPGFATWWDNLGKGIVNSLNKISDFIVSCRWYPTAPSIVAGLRPISVGLFTTSAKGYLVANNPNVTNSGQWTVPKHPQAATRGAYLNGAPYSRYTISSGFTGELTLDPYLVAQASKLNFAVNMDITTGQAKILINDPDNNRTLLTTYGEFGIPIQMEAFEVNALGLVNAGVQTVANAAVGNWLGAASGVMNALDYAQFTPGGKAGSGGYIAFTQPLLLNCEFFKIVDEDLADKGRPLYKVKQISTLSGFLMCDNADISLAATPGEIETVNAYLNNGMFYE